MIHIPESDEPFTVGKLRELINELPDSTLVVCEDGNWSQSFVEGGKICTNVMVGEEVKRTFVSTDELEEVRKEEPSNEVLPLAQAVLCIEIPAVFRGKAE